MKALDVISGTATWIAEQGDNLPWLRALPPASVSLVFFSPPYEGQRLYLENGVTVAKPLSRQAWVDWMRQVIVESARVSAGLVAVNMASPVEGGSYTAAVEWLVADLTRVDGLICGPSPYAWVKSEDYDDALGNGTPGSGGRHYHRRDWEPIYCFCLPGRQATKSGNPEFWSDNKAFGRPPKYQAGGDPSHRRKDGKRANDRKQSQRFANGTDGMVKGSHDREIVNHKLPEPFMGYDPPPISNPGNVLSDGIMANDCVDEAGDVLRVPVGGGKLGCPIAHEGEAPMAMGVAERFVCWYVPPGGIVLDPFSGTGTTLHAGVKHGRRAIGIDLRQSQVDLTRRRMATARPELFTGDNAGMFAGVEE